MILIVNVVPKADEEPQPIIVHGVSIISMTGEISRSTATIRASMGGVMATYSAEDDGIGPIEAMYRAFMPLAPLEGFGWKDYAVKAIGEGVDVEAVSTVTLLIDGMSLIGQGVDKNTLHADAQAVAESIHKLRWHLWKKRQR